MDLREYLERDINNRIERLQEHHELFHALSGGKIKPIDLHMILSTYRQLTELNYAVIMYAEVFDEEISSRESHNSIKEWLNDAEEVLVEALNKSVR